MMKRWRLLIGWSDSDERWRMEEVVLLRQFWHEMKWNRKKRNRRRIDGGIN